jgi:hypothetical protein
MNQTEDGPIPKFRQDPVERIRARNVKRLAIRLAVALEHRSLKQADPGMRGMWGM